MWHHAVHSSLFGRQLAAWTCAVWCCLTFLRSMSPGASKSVSATTNYHSEQKLFNIGWCCLTFLRSMSPGA
jgi:hypothetical protein